MTLALTVLSICLPVFALAAIGLVWVRLGHAYDTAFVTRLAMTLAVPALIFTALAGTRLDPAALGRIAAAAGGAYAALGLAALALCLVARLELRTWLAPMVFGNTGNLGLPLCLFAYGETGLALAVAVFAVTALLQFTLGLWIVSGGGSPWPALREPMVGATLLGALVLWRGWALPEAVTNALELLAQMAIPLMLLTLGVAMARLRAAGLGRAAALGAAKLALGAAAGWAAARAAGLDAVATGVLVVQLAMPAPVTAYLLAERFGADAPSVAGLVLASTLIAVAALPALLAVLI